MPASLIESETNLADDLLRFCQNLDSLDLDACSLSGFRCRLLAFRLLGYSLSLSLSLQLVACGL